MLAGEIPTTTRRAAMLTDSGRVRWGFAVGMMLAIVPEWVVAGPTPAQKCAATTCQ